MVGIDALSQQTSAVRQLAEHHERPDLARSTRRACCSPSGSGAPSRGASSSAPPRWRTRSAPRWSSCTRRSAGRRSTPRDFVDGIAALEESTGIAFAVENMYPWRASSRRGMEMYLPGWDPSRGVLRQHHDRPLARRDRRSPTRSRWPSGSGDRLRHIHLTDGTGSAKDEHLVPGRGVDGRRAVPAAPGRDAASTARSSLEINTRKCASREEREARPARVAGVRPRALRGDRRREHAPARRARRAGGPAPRTPAPRSSPRPGSCSPTSGFAGTTIRAVAAAAGVDAALVHHYFGTKDDLFVAALELPVDPRAALAPAIAGGPGRRGRADAAASSSSVWDDPEHRLPAARAGPRACSTPTASACCATASCRSVLEPVGVALGLDRPGACGCRCVASQVLGLIVVRYVLEVEPLASMPADAGGRDLRAHAPALPHRPAAHALTGPGSWGGGRAWGVGVCVASGGHVPPITPVTPTSRNSRLCREPSRQEHEFHRLGGETLCPLPPPSIKRTIHHMMKNAVEVRDLVVVRGGREVLRPRLHDRRRGHRAARAVRAAASPR